MTPPRERVLVIGGTGPTGIPIVAGLVERGHTVTILHRGTHERAETPDSVEHIHADPYDADSLTAALQGRTFDVGLAMYGRLRRVAEVTRGRVGRFLSVGGVPALRGWMNPFLADPAGTPVPLSDTAPTVAHPDEDEKGFRVARTEEHVFEQHPDAAHFRYPYAYGPYQVVPREWMVVRRILDGRRRIIVADGGLTLHHHGYTENLAHAVLLGVDHPEAASGQIFNCGDDEVLSVAQVIELCAAALDHELEVVSLPFELAVPARPLVMQPLPTHRVLDTSTLRDRLGYHDVVPAREAVGRTARWLAANRPEPGGMEEVILTDPFDYDAEDRLLAAWDSALAGFPEVTFERAPGWGHAYSGPGGRPRSRPTFEA
ncbi:NAD(P)H-binding protein [Rhabdothermincola salaria]|uniref:NAD(P)H-binding protein n=1 Tax=Rhabdothermincola salaria TaxID=2903142 RepID=UPI001E3AEA4C|nr:NAD(P)H-binding protein [Rhabdothermincola salaria]MCD9622949.1 NAD(P)H-binding protein [Rhabdothermincola salaria]